MKLITPANYESAPDRIKKRICNGTGAAGTPKWLVNLLDDFLGLGINLSEAANRHDWCYYWYKHWWEKIFADLTYFLNMIIICINVCFQLPLSTALGNIMLFPVRIILRVIPYFLAVFIFGFMPFYYGKAYKINKKPQH